MLSDCFSSSSSEGVVYCQYSSFTDYIGTFLCPEMSVLSHHSFILYHHSVLPLTHSENCEGLNSEHCEGLNSEYCEV